jgi:fucose permease
MYFGNSFIFAKVLFAAVGASFALIKVSVYASVGLVTENEKQHNSLMSSIEGVFMFGIALAYFLFPAFNSASDENAWLDVYWLLAALSVVSFLFLLYAPFDKPVVENKDSNLLDDFTAMFKLIAQLLVIVFVIAAFLFVMIEQGIMTWLPTFNDRVLELPENLAIMMASILAVSLGVGRLLAGYLSNYFNWVWILIVCIIAAMLMVYFVLPMAVESKISGVETLADIPLLGYAFPIVGLFIAPIYPMLNSVILSALPKSLHSHMSGLIIIFSAIGGTLGSRLIGILFKEVGAAEAFSYTLIPMALLLVSILILKKLTAKN